MTGSEDVHWWEEPERLDEANRQRVLQAAASVLARRGDADLGGQNVTEIPPSALMDGLREAVEEQGLPINDDVVRGLVEGSRATEAALTLLRELGRDQWLREAVDDAYRAAGQLMVLDPGTLAVAAVLLLVAKIRHIRVGKDGADMEFDSVREGVLTKILGI